VDATGTEYTLLLDAYKTALREWTKVRAIKPMDAQDVLEATRLVEEIERKIRGYSGAQLVKYQPPDARKA